MVGVRAVANEPTRIEAYDEQGNLLFIDAEGNGTFNDPGDLLATRNVSGMVPLLELGATQRLIEFRYKVHDRRRSEFVEVQIQHSEAPAIDDWKTDAIDKIQLKPVSVILDAFMRQKGTIPGEAKLM